MVWAFLVNGIFGFRQSIDMKKVPNEAVVYQVLKQHIAEPGKYLCNPGLTESGMFPLNEPVYGILYGGVGHEAAGPLSVVLDFLLAIITVTIAAFLLSLTSDKIISSYYRKVLFFILIGLIFAVSHDLRNYGIGNYPLHDALILALHNILLWAVLGLITGLIIKRPVQPAGSD